MGKSIAIQLRSLLFLSVLLTQTSCSKEPQKLETDLIIDINEFTYSIANEYDQFHSFIGVRALTMVHLAIHDMLNAADPQYEGYHINLPIQNIDLGAAAISASQTILLEAYPSRADTIHQVCSNWLDKIETAATKTTGIDIGEKVARSYIQLRQGDGHEKNGDYTPMTKPGDYQFTTGFDWVWKPDFSVARPFTLDSINQFRCAPPPSLQSETYAKSYEEVKKYGEKGSKVRSEDQTHYAHWWAEFGEHSWNRIGRITAHKQQLSAIEANRMFALINMNLYDLYLVSFDSKYNYDTWRPVTAIQEGNLDDNPLTTADPDWEPEMLTPPWPEYPSAHAAVGASGATIIAQIFGSNQVSFAMESTTALPEAKQRTYTDLNLAAEHCASSRVMNGFHFRFATDVGLDQGRAVAKHTLQHFLKKL